MPGTKILIAILIAVVSVNWSPAQSTVPVDVSALQQSYRVGDRQYQFEMNLPANWCVDTKNTRRGFISLYPKESGKNPALMFLSAYPLAELGDLHTQADFDRRERNTVEDVGHIIDQRTMLLDGLPASAIIFVTFPPQPNKMVVDIGLVHDGMVYAMSLHGTVKQVLHYFPEFSAIAASFHLKGPVANPFKPR